MNFRMIGLVAVVSALTGCMTPPPPQTVSLNSRFDADEAKRMLAPGSATIEGNAFMRQQGGGVVTCAGSVVELIPATAYASERIGYLYGPGAQVGFNRRSLVFTPDDPVYNDATHKRRAVCDSQGRFTFDKVLPGDFFIVTGVSWVAGDNRQGGALMARVHADAGETARVIMSH